MGRNPRGTSRNDAELRIRLAQHAARLIADEGIRDPRRALRKAADRLGARDESQWPDAGQLDAALREHQRLFAGDRQPGALNARRQAAVEAMRFLAAFDPRLVGPVLDGTADAHTPVTLQLFVDDADAVVRFLVEQQIPHRLGERRLRHAGGRQVDYPLLAFVADDIDFELVVLPQQALREAAFDSTDRPLTRATLGTVRALLDAPPG